MNRIIRLLLFGFVIMSSSAEGGNLPEITLEPMSLTVSKFKRDGFGKGINPYNRDMLNRVISGTELIVKVTTEPSQQLLNSACKLHVFRDDQGVNLLEVPDSAKGSRIFINNQSFSVNSVRDKESFALTFRSPLVVATNATKVMVEGVLAFAQSDAEESAEHASLVLATNIIVRVGPVRIRFDQTPMPSHAAGVNKSKNPGIQPKQNSTWNVKILPDLEAFGTRLFIYGSDDEIPVFDSGDPRYAATQNGNRTRSNNPSGNDEFAHLPFRRVKFPNGEISRIKVRYTSSENIIEVPFGLETDLRLIDLSAL